MNVRIRRLIRHFFEFLRDIYLNRTLILTLARRDIATRYLGSALGLLWAFAQPAITLLVMWFVFQYGLKSPPVIDFPFSLWLVAGMIPWFFISDGLSGATYSILEYRFLVKNVTVRLSILPIVKILSGLFIHGFLVGLMLVLFLIYGIWPDIYALQILYYIFAAIVLLLGLSWVTSSLILFLKDVGQVVGIVLQLGFWATPIIWNINLIPPNCQWMIKFNPALYIVEGFRDALIYKVWFWDHAYLTAYYWCFTAAVFLFGAVLFKRLRPHFADVI